MKDAQTSPLPQAWISAREGARLVCRSTRTVRTLAERGLVKAFEVPGLRPLYFRPDLEKFAPPQVATTSAN